MARNAHFRRPQRGPAGRPASGPKTPKGPRGTPLICCNQPLLVRLLERETGFEPATSTLARSRSTAELFPRRDGAEAAAVPLTRQAEKGSHKSAKGAPGDPFDLVPSANRPEGGSGKRDLNPRHRPWQGRALPLSYSRGTGPKPGIQGVRAGRLLVAPNVVRRKRGHLRGGRGSRQASDPVFLPQRCFSGPPGCKSGRPPYGSFMSTETEALPPAFTATEAVF